MESFAQFTAAGKVAQFIAKDIDSLGRTAFPSLGTLRHTGCLAGRPASEQHGSFYQCKRCLEVDVRKRQWQLQRCQYPQNIPLKQHQIRVRLSLRHLPRAGLPFDQLGTFAAAPLLAECVAALGSRHAGLLHTQVHLRFARQRGRDGSGLFESTTQSHGTARVDA